MSFSGNLLAKSSYLPRFISLVPSKQQQSEISSEDDETHKNKQKIVKDGRNNPMRNHESNDKNLQRKNNQTQKCHQNCHQNYNANTLNYHMQIKPKFDDLLHVPSQDYQEKSAMLFQRRIEEQIRKRHERELYYGKKKSQIVEISDVSSQEQGEEKKQKNTKKRMIQNIDFQEDELLRRYGIEKQDLRHKKEQQNKKDQKTNSKVVISIPSTNRSSNQKENKNNKTDKRKDNKENRKEENLFEHLHPDFQEEKPQFQAHDDSSQQLSQIDSDKSIIVIRKKKHTHKRLKKMNHVSNKVKIQNKQNSGQTHQCPICLTDLNKKLEKKKGKLPCNHMFCLKCITQSSKFSNRCPYCRASYNEIMSNGKRIQVQDTHYNEQYEDPNDEPCYICGRNDDFEHLLECEFCQYAYCHTYCDPRLNNRQQPPEEVWHCASCEQLLRQRDENGEFNEQEQQYRPQQQQNGSEIEAENYSNGQE